MIPHPGDGSAVAARRFSGGTLTLNDVLRWHPDLHFLVSADNTILQYYGGSAGDLYAPPDAFLGQMLQAVLPETVATRISEGLNRARAKAGQVVVIDYALPVSGQERTFEARLIPFDHGYVLAVCRDVTRQRQAEAALGESERRFRQIAEAIDQVIWLADAESGRVLYVSPAFESIWGRPSQELYANPGLCHDTIVETERAAVRAQEESWIRNGRTVPLVHSYPIVRTDGTVRWILSTTTAIRRDDGTVYRVGGVAKDITSDRDAELTRRSLEGQLAQAHKMEAIRVLTAGIAHHLNNALTVIIGGAELARLEGPADAAALGRHLGMVLEASAGAQALVQQLRTFARQSATELCWEDLGPVVTRAAEGLRPTLPPLVELTVYIDAGVPSVLADVMQVEQALANLVTNATEALDGQAGRIDVQLERFDAIPELVQVEPDFVVGPYTRLSVADNGAGIEESTRKRLFDPFFTTGDMATASGLGLSVVHGVIARHGGVIRVQSDRGIGTRVDLYFPARELPASIRST